MKGGLVGDRDRYELGRYRGWASASMKGGLVGDRDFHWYPDASDFDVPR